MSGMYCSAATPGSIALRPTTEIMPPSSWPMRMRRTMSLSSPSTPSAYTVKPAGAPAAPRHASPTSSSTRSYSEPRGASVANFGRGAAAGASRGSASAAASEASSLRRAIIAMA